MKIKKKLVENISKCQQKQLIAQNQQHKLTTKCTTNGDEIESKTVIVSINILSHKRDLLTWALANVAVRSDTVIALHVLPSHKVKFGAKSSSSLLSLVKAFDSVLEEFEGFCNLKQIELKMKICRGSSISNVLIQQVKSCAAKCLVVGVTKNDHEIGYSSTSMARHCAKIRPQNCSIFAVHNGKVVFNKEAMRAPQSSAFRRGLNSTITVKNCNNIELISEQFARKSNALITSLHCIHTKFISWDQRFSSSCLSVPKEKEFSYTELTKNDSFVLVPVNKSELLTRSLSQLFRNTTDTKPGWPLLQKAVYSDRKSSSKERSKMSVVEWAMQLPSRYSAASVVHPDQNPARPYGVAEESEEKRGAIVPFASDIYNSPSIMSDKQRNTSDKFEFLRQKYSSVCRLFSYVELAKITCNFSAENLVGEGGNSRVYRGCLSDGKELAVKILKNSEDMMNEFVSEIDIITSLHHKNVISLFGFSFDNDKLILVYDFLSRGSLEDTLHGNINCENTMNWEERYKVSVGVAEALAYLHRAQNAKPVIHRDVKSSNILLDHNFEPQLSDFGFAKWTSDQTTESPRNYVAGTFGYLAPEYLMYGKVDEKADVYAFGVVLLELLSGRKPVSTGCPKGEESLVFWARKILRGGKVKHLLDPCLGSDYDEDQFDRMVVAASLCVERFPRSRPQIELALRLLKGDTEALKCARAQNGVQIEIDELDDDCGEAEARHCDIQSHINLALLNVDDDSLSVSSNEPSVEFITANMSLEEYLQGKCSRSSSFT